MVCGSHHVPLPYLNTVPGKDISLPAHPVLHMWLETGHIRSRQRRSHRHLRAMQGHLIHACTFRLKI